MIVRRRCAPEAMIPKRKPKGLADILVVKDGKAIFIEVKAIQGACPRISMNSAGPWAGGGYHVCRSIHDVQKNRVMIFRRDGR
jgi:hypothetical protein